MTGFVISLIPLLNKLLSKESAVLAKNIP